MKRYHRYWSKVQRSIGMIFIPSIEYSSKVNPASIQQLNGLLSDECRRNGFKLQIMGQFLKLISGLMAVI